MLYVPTASTVNETAPGNAEEGLPPRRVQRIQRRCETDLEGSTNGLQVWIANSERGEVLMIGLGLCVSELQRQVRLQAIWEAPHAEDVGACSDERHETAIGFGVAGERRPLHPHRPSDRLSSPRSISARAAKISWGRSMMKVCPPVRSSTTVSPWRAPLGCFSWACFDRIRSIEVCSAVQPPLWCRCADCATSFAP